ncbi:hypothetical protein ACQP2T_19510 [Nonomuraea sp. CA-143628]
MGKHERERDEKDEQKDKSFETEKPGPDKQAGGRGKHSSDRGGRGEK